MSDAALRSLVFDFDGLIVDTETSSFETVRDLYRRHGAELTLAHWQQRIGTHGRPWLDELEEVVGPLADRDAVLEERRLAHHERVMAEEALPGVVAFVKAAAAAGLSLAVASSSSRGWVAEHLERLDLRERFAVLSCCAPGERPKPDSHLYRRALDGLGVLPSQAVAFEDSPNGITAAKGAGLVCVAVPNRMTAGLDLGAGDLVVASFEDLDLATVRALHGELIAGGTGGLSTPAAVGRPRTGR